ncbi:MAG: acyl-CoA dehydrogenase [Paracoccaceae bacterium]
MPYRAPVKDIRFLFDHVVGLPALLALRGKGEDDVIPAVLTEAGRLCDQVLAPLNRAGDLTPARLVDGAVRATPGFAAAYARIAEGGWVGIAARPDHGGMGLPMVVASAVNDMMAGACMALGLNPLLTQGQIEALEHHADADMQALYLPKLISGEWSGTMNLTEPEAGSDVGALRTRAVPNGDGSYAITGQKIFISWGDADFLPNVCHLVLARLPDAAPGTRGISLFMVPRNIPDENGNPGAANSLRVVSLEHKTGLHGSPTAVMEFAGATGWMVGAPHTGMKAMFTMMNNARLNVGMQGVGVAEAASQQAAAFAQDRVQGKTPLGAGPIADHADVRRMLAAMRADTFAARAIALACGVAIDMGRETGAPEWQARAALLTPIAKAFGTDIGHEVAQMGVQVHGGMGYIEETGASQFARDVRVTAIYEGTNGIQAMDLVGRKLADGGAAALALIDEVIAGAAARDPLPALADAVTDAARGLRDTTLWMATAGPDDRNAGAAAYLRAFARVLGGHFHLVAARADAARAPLATIYITRLLPEYAGLLAQARAGAGALYDLGMAELAS